MLPVTEEESHVWANRIYVSTAGATFATIIGCILLLNVSYKYHTLYKECKAKAKAQKKAYFLVFLYLSFITLGSFAHAVIRTNIITRIDSNQWTKIQCAIGYSMSYHLYYLSLGVLYIIFIYRVNTTLSESIYAYHPYISYTFYSIIIIMDIWWCSNVICELIIAEWEVVQHEGISICINFVNNAHPWYDEYYRYIAAFTAIFSFTANAVLLLMFVKGLWSVNKLFINSFVNEFCPESEASNDDKSIYEMTSLSISLLPNETQRTQSDMDVVLNKLVTDRKSKKNAKHILRLYGLIKKQTILCFIAVCSSLVYWCLVAWNDWFAIQFYWDVWINAICVWLMLGSSSKYWKICTKTFLRSCYRKENVIN